MVTLLADIQGNEMFVVHRVVSSGVIASGLNCPPAAERARNTFKHFGFNCLICADFAR